MSLQHVVNKVECTITCSLWAQDRAAPFHALTGEGCSMELTGELLVHAKQIANLSTTNADITGRNIHIRTNHLVQLAHECLAETHNLGIALTTGSKVGSALTATHRQGGKCILEGLLETEELQDTEVY